jgi:glutaconyl-CoA/methylmalonyl-CoA decarboxylase subunit gamma
MKYNVTINNQKYEVEVEKGKATIVDTTTSPAPSAQVSAKMEAPLNVEGEKILAPMPGSVVKIVAKVGQSVKKGDIILVLEAMKMENEIGSPVDGKVKAINVTKCQNVKPGFVMAVIGK